MKNNYKESFEQIRIAGTLAAETLDEVTSYVRPGVTTEKLDNICYEFIKDVLPKLNYLYPEIRFHVVGNINFYDKYILGSYKNVIIILVNFRENASFYSSLLLRFSLVSWF